MLRTSAIIDVGCVKWGVVSVEEWFMEMTSIGNKEREPGAPLINNYLRFSVRCAMLTMLDSYSQYLSCQS